MNPSPPHDAASGWPSPSPSPPSPAIPLAEPWRDSEPSIAFFQPSYAADSIPITLYVIFTIGSDGLGSPQPNVGLVRLAATLAGSAISVAAYVLWPAFQGRHLKEVVDEAVTSLIEFCERVKDREKLGDQNVEDARNRARQLRLRAEMLSQSAILEPWGVSKSELDFARHAIRKLDENSAEILALLAEPAPAHDEIDRVRDAACELKKELADQPE